MVPGRSVSCVSATGYWSVLLSASGVRAEPECTPSATTWMYSPNDPTRPRCRRTGGGRGAAGGSGVRFQNPPPLATGTGGADASGGARGGSGLAMLNHAGQCGPRPPPPREHFEYPNGSPILNAKYARKKYGVSAQSGRRTIFIWSS